MLQITIPEAEYFDESIGVFFYTKKQTLQLEHSLVSLSKWEEKWKKPFFAKERKTNEEINDYVRCMTITQNVDPNVYKYIPNDIIDLVIAYMDDPMTATKFFDKQQKNGKQETVTAELIYYWMLTYNIPYECRKWHLNKLLTLVQVCNIKNASPKKMSKKEIMNRNKSLNAARRKSLNSKG